MGNDPQQAVIAPRPTLVACRIGTVLTALVLVFLGVHHFMVMNALDSSGPPYFTRIRLINEGDGPVTDPKVSVRKVAGGPWVSVTDALGPRLDPIEPHNAWAPDANNDPELIYGVQVSVDTPLGPKTGEVNFGGASDVEVWAAVAPQTYQVVIAVLYNHGPFQAQSMHEVGP